MNGRHHLITLTAGGAILAAFLTGCAASPRHGSGSLESAKIASGVQGSGALASHIASAAQGGGSSTSGSIPHTGPTRSPQPDGARPGDGAPGAASRSGPPTDRPSAIPAITASGLFFTDDYAVRATGNCWWEMNDARQLYLTAQFTVSYAGPDPVTVIPYVATIGDGSGTGNTQHSAALATATFNVRAGGESRTSSPWLGNTVPLTMRLEPTSNDSSAADNVATTLLALPSSTPQVDLFTPVTC